MISVQQLTKQFGAQTAVDGITFEIPAGQIVGFLGPNGAGKSTTLKMLTGMLAPTSGTATICGFDLEKDIIEVKRHVGFVPESGTVFESLTGLEYLEMVAALYAIPEEAARKRIEQFITFFDLGFQTLTDKLLGAYSKGMRRKVVITAALLHNPPVVFFDEPLDGLDANAAVGFKALIQTLAREGKTIVYNSHILDVVERVCDRVLIIDKGKLLLDGQPEALVAASGAGTLERLFTQLTGGTELEQRAEDFADDFPAMTEPGGQAAAGSPDRALRKLFLTLFLRGRGARGLRRETAPTSIGSRLARQLLTYAVVGLVASFAFIHGPVFTLALYLHGMTLLFCGMFIAASGGETLFNKDEADILLHRPITPRALLQAKLGVLCQVSLWIAGAFNLAGMVGGLWAKDSGWLFPVAHAVSTALEALFCTGAVVLGYEICLRSFGRERLDNVMTTVQVLVAVAAVAGGQLVPRMITRVGLQTTFSGDLWWMWLLPPAWFAGFDDAIAGGRGLHSWALAAVGVLVTATIIWLALRRMARHYETGLQVLGEAPAASPAQRPGRRLLTTLVHTPPLSWCLRNPVHRASFLLVTQYMLRDRDVKLRLYPGIAPMLVVPIAMLLPNRGGGVLGDFGVAFAGSYLGMIPLFALNLLQYSQQWAASDVFRVAPLPGPAPLCAGARQAVSCFITLPFALAFAAIIWWLHRSPSSLVLLVPGLIALPIFTLYSHLGGQGVPFSVASEEARSASRGLSFMLIMFVSMGLSGIALWAWSTGWFRWFLIGEAISVAALYALMRASVAAARWSPAE